MLNDKTTMLDQVASTVTLGSQSVDTAAATGVYKIQCHDAQGNLKWEAESKNLVVNGGLQDMNAKYFTGSAYTATWYLGLYGAGASNTPAASDTMSSHAGWTENTGYSNATRPVCTFDTPTTEDHAMRVAKVITVTAEERASLTKGACGRSTPARLVFEGQDRSRCCGWPAE